MMQAGVCLRQDTETTLPELTEQHRIRQKEEELSGLESVHMAESQTECAAPGLNTLEPECFTAHSGVSDVHHTHTSLIKTETDLGSSHTGDLKTESRECTELGYVTHLYPDQIKTEADDGGYLKAEHISDLQVIECVDIKSDPMKYESSECSVNDLMNTVMNGAAVGHKDQTESGQCAGEPNQNCKNEEIHHLLTQCADLNHNSDINNENTQPRIVRQKSTNSQIKHIDIQGTNVINEPMIINSSKNPSLLTFFHKTTIQSNQRKINMTEKRYRCTRCEKYFSQKSTLNSHMRIHTGEKPYKCTECEKCFSQKSSLNSHKRIHSGEKPFKCTECEKCFSQKSILYSHKRIHTGEKPYKCTECGKSFPRIFNLNRHQSIHTAPMIIKSSKNPNLLNLFQKKTIRRSKSEINTGEKPHRCTQCVKSFSWKCLLNNHMRIHTGEKPYKCTECEKCFSQKSSLNSHKRIHSGEKPYTCSECGKCFFQITVLNDHKMIHSGQKPYKCTHCGKCFTQKKALNRHKIIHTGEKPYRCTQCEKCFSQRSNLNIHMRIHTGEKPYICTECGMSFSRIFNLNRHQNIHTAPMIINSSKNPNLISFKRR